MNITVAFFLGLFVTLVGVIPPGLLNINAAKISLKEGPSRGIMFSIGVCVTVAIQTFLAATLSRYLSMHPDVVEILQRIAFVIFVLISIYFLKVARRNKEPKINVTPKSKNNRFFYGMFLAALNLFPIPYQAYMTLSLVGLGWLTFESVLIASYVAGAAMGTFIMLYVYIFFFEKIRSSVWVTQRNMNYFIGIITGAVAVITLINIIKDL